MASKKNNLFKVDLDVDFTVKGERWCTKHLNPWEWNTDGNSFYFQLKETADTFQLCVNKWINNEEVDEDAA